MAGMGGELETGIQIEGADNTVIGNVTDSLKVAVTQSALPSGAATATNQATIITSIQILDDVPSAQNGAFVKGAPAMGQLDDTSTVVATEDNVAAVRITPQRAFHINLRNTAGTEVGTAASPLRIDPTGTTPQPASQSGAWTTGRTWVISSGTDSISSVQSGAWTTGRTWTLSSGTDSISVTQGTSPWVTSRNWTLSASTDTLLGYGQATTGAPTYSNATPNPLSLTLAGALRTDASATIQPVVGTGSNGSPNGGVLSVQGVPGGTAQPVSQSGTWTVRNQDASGNNMVVLNAELQTRDVCDAGGVQGAITVGTSAVLAAAVGGANLVNRKCLTIYNNGTVIIYYGHTNAVTTSTGIPVVPGTSIIFSIGDSTNVYLISGTASQNVRVTEMA